MPSRSAEAERPIRFGEGYELELRPRRLRRGRHVIPIERIPLEILILLIERKDEIVTRDEIVSRVWGKGVFLDTDNSIRGAIRKLRQALKDDAANARFIETITGQGYRFIAPVTLPIAPRPSDSDLVPPATAPSEHGPGSASTASPQPNRRWPMALSILSGLGVLAILISGPILLLSHTIRHEVLPRPAVEHRLTSNSLEVPIQGAIVSPDGKYLAYSDRTGLYLRVIVTGETHRWDLPKDFMARVSSWFPDGTHVLVSRPEGMPPKVSLWKLSILGGPPQQLAENAMSGIVSPDGSRIAFMEFRLPSWGHELWVMNADGSSPRTIGESTSSDRTIYTSAWSPNSRRIAYIERDPDNWSVTPLSSIWTRNSDGTDPQEIVRRSRIGTGIAWAADGRLLFASHANQAGARKWFLFRQSIDDTSADVLVQANYLSLPRLSADGTQVLYQSGNSEDPTQPMSLMRLPLADGAPQPVLQAIRLGNHQCARPPSTLCLFHKEEGKDSLYFSFDPTHGPTSEVLRSGIQGNWSLSPDGKTLAIFPGDHSIKFFSIANGSAHEMGTTSLNDWWVPNGDWSADGKTLLIPTFSSLEKPVILAVNQSGKASVVLKGTETSRFDFMVQAPDGKHAIVSEEVPGDSNAWMIDNF